MQQISKDKNCGIHHNHHQIYVVKQGMQINFPTKRRHTIIINILHFPINVWVQPPQSRYNKSQEDMMNISNLS